MRVVSGGGSELDREPLGVAISMLRPLALEIAAGDDDLAADLRSLIYGRDPALPGDRFTIVEGLFSICAGAAERKPTVMVVDDLQWVDQGTRALVARIGREVAELPLCMILSLRTGEPGAEQLSSSLSKLTGLESLRPDVLSRAAVDELVRESLGPEVPEEVRAACATASGGNPLLLSEVLREVRSRGLSVAGSAAQILALAPSSVIEFVAARLQHCSAGGRSLALALATLGVADESRDNAVLSAAAGLEPEALPQARGDLEQLELVEAGEPLRIRHPLFRRAIYESASPETLADARLRSARALVDAGHHARAGTQLLAQGAPETPGATDGEWIVDALTAASGEAVRHGDRDDAIRFLDRALTQPGVDGRRGDLLAERGRILSLDRNPEAIGNLRDALAQTDDPRRAGEIALILAQACFYLVRLEEGAAICREAIAALGEGERELRLRLEAEALNSDRLRGAERVRPRELEAEVSGGATPAERATLVHVAAEAVATGERPAAEINAMAIRAWNGGTLLEESGPDAPLISFLGTAMAWCEDFESARALAEAQLLAGRRRRAPMTISYALALRAGIRLRFGDLAEAEADAEQVVAELPASDPLAHMICLGWLLECLIARGKVEEAQQTLATSGLLGELPDLGTVDFLLLSRGDTRLAAGDVQAALADYEEVGARAERSGYLNPAGMAWRSRAALARLELGETARARELAAAEVAVARQFGAPRALAIALRSLALCSATGERTDLLCEAGELLEKSPARLERARVAIDLGWTLIATDRTEEAISPLQAAMDDAHRCGAVPLVTIAMDGLRAAGKRPRRPALRGRDALTAQQLRVAQLAAGGRSNREIAEALFLTRRTVELHLTGAYRKLEIESRAELVDTLAGG